MVPVKMHFQHHLELSIPVWVPVWSAILTSAMAFITGIAITPFLRTIINDDVIIAVSTLAAAAGGAGALWLRFMPFVILKHIHHHQASSLLPESDSNLFIPRQIKWAKQSRREKSASSICIEIYDSLKMMDSSLVIFDHNCASKRALAEVLELDGADFMEFLGVQQQYQPARDAFKQSFSFHFLPTCSHALVTALDGEDNAGTVKECVACLDSNATTAFAPCGHLCLCHDCTVSYVSLRRSHIIQCPMCRSVSFELWTTRPTCGLSTRED